MRTQMLMKTSLAILLAAGVAANGEAPADTAPDYSTQRQARAQALTRPDGWFSLVALAWLRAGETTVGSAADNTVVLAHVPAHVCTLRKAGSTVTVERVTAPLQVAGTPASAGQVLGAEEDGTHALTVGAVQMWVIDRGGQRYLRVKDPEAPARTHFHGLAWFAPKPQYRLTAKWVPYPADHTLAITNKLGQVSKESAPGYVAFSLDGQPQQLTPTVEGDKLFFVFRDATSRLETDGGGRFLTTDVPVGGLDRPGTVVLDFNQAVNPPCAYSPYATCPLAPQENRLKPAIPAGEKRYGE